MIEIPNHEPSISSMAMVELRNLVREFLNKGEPLAVNVVFSIAHYNDRNVFNDIMKDLLPNEIISIDMHDIPEDVDAFYANNAINNGWYGDGIFVAGTKDVYPYIKRACKLRDENKTLKKIYVWTLAKESSIKKYIDDAHVDGVFINVPGFVPASITGVQEALHVISNSTKARMAKRSDSVISVYKKK